MCGPAFRLELLNRIQIREWKYVRFTYIFIEYSLEPKHTFSSECMTANTNFLST